MKTPLHTLDGLEQEIARAPEHTEKPINPRFKTGARFLNLDTRVIQWLVDDARKLAKLEQPGGATEALAMLKRLKRRDPAVYNIDDELNRIIGALSAVAGGTVEPDEIESLIADRSSSRAAEAILEAFMVLKKCDCSVVCQDRRDDCRYRFEVAR
jgi:hypothetical protein